jgi:RNA polymerase sigma-70 factor (ECF subfamily)
LSETLLPLVSECEEAVDIDALYRVHARTVARWALRLGGPAVDAEDIVQEVFLIAKRRLRRFARGAKITTWLFRTTDRLVRGVRRRQRVRGLLWRTHVDPAPALDGGPSPLEALERQETRLRVYRILDRLPEKQRRVLILFELDGLSTHEIAELLEARLSTVRVWLHRARGRFAELDQQLAGDDDGEPRKDRP